MNGYTKHGMYTMQYSSAVKEKENLAHGTTLLSLGGITLREINHPCSQRFSNNSASSLRLQALSTTTLLSISMKLPSLSVLSPVIPGLGDLSSKSLVDWLQASPGQGRGVGALWEARSYCWNLYLLDWSLTQGHLTCQLPKHVFVSRLVSQHI